MKEINYQKRLFKTLKINYVSFLLGMFTILIPVIIFSLKNITILPLSNLFKTKSAYPSQSEPTIIKTSHIVKEGEDLWSISEKYLGSGYYAFQIASFNNLKEPFTLVPNQKIFIPTIHPTIVKSGEILPDAASTQRSNDTTLIYTVKEGEYLFQIAENIYGNGDYMNKIIVANDIPYPYNIEIGQKLLIPR